MRGRIYDPELGRFLQADPFVQAPDNSQSLNRYSYVLNNPLSYTDPSGFFFKSLLSSVFQTVFTIAGCSVPGANVVTCFTTATMVSGMTGAANDQPFLNAVRDGAISGVTAVAFMQVGAAVRAGHISPEAGVVLHGAVGAGAAAARGGDPLAGFAAAALTKSFTLGAEGFLDQINNDAIEALIAGAVGGTISEVTGGKFANGAVTAAIAYVYNQVLSEQTFDTREEAIEAQLEKAKRVHATFNKSRRSRIRRTRGKQPGSETGFDRQPIGGFIFKKKSFFSREVSFRVTLRVDIAQAAGFIDAFAEGAPRDAAALAVFTNPKKDQRLDFSSVSSNLDGTPVFVEIPNGTVFQFTPKGCSVFRGDASCD